ncbi:hypothetical protein [Streptomyces sp. CBMA29]|uniref:hypothetical protein n=1 Tax=Streptomyces sp. CBMA29 TaxID=1896314 RepID=UPI001661BD74|nr:hypothetical protein [Streptomyces sp. CBMA29]MBD0736058.1 hypothetical protein [Streptomyces sp. CBMA29]
MTAAISVQVLTVDELLTAMAEHFGSEHTFLTDHLPNLPGVYVWSTDDRVVYIGSAASLAKRVSDEKGWIAGHEPDEQWAVTVVHMLKIYNATVQWVATADHAEALLLERRLIEWHRTCTGMGPLVVGWEAKKESPRKAGEMWAQELWKRKFGQ